MSRPPHPPHPPHPLRQRASRPGRIRGYRQRRARHRPPRQVLRCGKFPPGSCRWNRRDVPPRARRAAVAGKRRPGRLGRGRSFRHLCQRRRGGRVPVAGGLLAARGSPRARVRTTQPWMRRPRLRPGPPRHLCRGRPLRARAGPAVRGTYPRRLPLRRPIRWERPGDPRPLPSPAGPRPPPHPGGRPWVTRQARRPAGPRRVRRLPCGRR